MNKLTVLVSCYNSGEWLENRIQNLLQSTHAQHTEVVCINANSPDPLDDEIPRRHPVTYFKLEERVSVYEAWNYAIQRTQSDFIANANTDDLVAPDCYERLINALNDTRADYCYPSWYVTNVPNLRWGEHHPHVDPSGSPGHYNGDLNTSGVGHFPMWRRSLHDRIGYFNPSFNALGDAEFWARAYYCANAQFYWYNERLAIYLWRDGQNLWNSSINEVEWRLYHQLVDEYRSRHPR